MIVSMWLRSLPPVVTFPGPLVECEREGLGKGVRTGVRCWGFGMGRVWGKWLGSGAGEVGLGSGLGEVGLGKWYWGSGIGEVGVWEVGFGKWAQQGAKFDSGRNRAQKGARLGAKGRKNPLERN